MGGRLVILTERDLEREEDAEPTRPRRGPFTKRRYRRAFHENKPLVRWVEPCRRSEFTTRTVPTAAMKSTLIQASVAVGWPEDAMVSFLVALGTYPIYFLCSVMRNNSTWCCDGWATGWLTVAPCSW